MMSLHVCRHVLEKSVKWPLPVKVHSMSQSLGQTWPVHVEPKSMMARNS